MKEPYPYDEFVSNNMDSSGYKKTCVTLKEYIRKYEHKDELSEIFTDEGLITEEMIQMKNK